MDNSQRDMEKNRIKRETTENLKSRWSVLFINSTGEVFTVSYVKALFLTVIGLFSASIIAIVVLASILSVTISKNHNLVSELAIIKADSSKFKEQNEILRAKLALLDSKPKAVVAKQNEVKEIKKEEVKKTQAVIQVPISEILIPEKEVDDRSIKVQEYQISVDNGQIHVKFDILNNLVNDQSVSGYIFAILENTENKRMGSMISPYSEIIGGLPKKPSRGQFFAISRFKPVTIKFPKSVSLENYDNVNIVIYSRDKKLVFKKGFPINEK